MSVNNSRHHVINARLSSITLGFTILAPISKLWQATISATVLDSAGRLVMEAIVETKAATILQFIHGVRGDLQVTFEEGTCAAWLYDLLKPHVTHVLVCDPRKNALLKVGNKSNRIDARKLAELLCSNLLRSVYHEDTGIRAVKELARSYMTITRDLTRVMVRLKALYRSWAIPCAGQQVYAPRRRAEWLGKIAEAGVCRRAEFYYQQLDALLLLHQQARQELLAESKKHNATKLLRQVPSIVRQSFQQLSGRNPVGRPSAKRPLGNRRSFARISGQTAP